MKRPCKNCPWRRDATVGYWHREHFENIAETCRGDGLHRMCCHHSTQEDPVLCQGWIEIEGFAAIGVRLAVFSGELLVEDVEGVSGLDLYPSMDEMIEAQRPRWPPAEN